MPEHSEDPSKPAPRKATAPVRVVLTVACDTVCGIALILLACSLAGFLRRLAGCPEGHNSLECSAFLLTKYCNYVY